MSMLYFDDPDPIPLCDNCSAAFEPSHNFDHLNDCLAQLRTSYSLPSYAKTNADIRLHLEESLQHYDEELLRLNAIRRKLERQREELEEYVEVLEAIDAPIRRLPTEILVEIFTHRVLSIEAERGDRRDNKAPLRLSLVCSRWRDIMLASKFLWSYIQVDTEFRRYYDEGLLKKQLENSHPVPLTVTVVAYKRFDDDEPSLRMLAACSQRWYDVDMRLVTPHFHERGFLSLVHNNLPLLEKMTLRIYDYYNIPATPLFMNCPKLHDVSLNRTTPTALPLHQITAFESTFGNLEDMLQVLRSCPQLSRLAIVDAHFFGNSYMKWPEPWSSNNHVENYLQHLSIDLPDTRSSNDLVDNVVSFFRGITLPHLQTLRVADLQDGARRWVKPWPQKSFMALLQRSMCSLSSLTIERIGMADNELLEILRLLPTLTSLSIFDFSKAECEGEDTPVITDHILRSLTHFPQTSSDQLLPRLKHLKLIFEPHQTREENTVFTDMIQSRWRVPDTSMHSAEGGGVACLEYADLGFLGVYVDRESVKRLRVLQAEGLRLRIA